MAGKAHDIIMKKLNSVDDLPSIPIVIDKITEAINDVDSSAAHVARLIEDLRATIVLTAHPTDAMRLSISQTLARIELLLDQRASESEVERERAEREIVAELTAQRMGPEAQYALVPACRRAHGWAPFISTIRYIHIWI